MLKCSAAFLARLMAEGADAEDVRVARRREVQKLVMNGQQHLIGVALKREPVDDRLLGTVGG